MDIRSLLPSVIVESDREAPWSEWVPGAVLFADVSGFTPMSEALAVLGAEGGEVLTDVLNRYFAAMIGIVHARGGQVMKFGGDAILCFFPEAEACGGGRQQGTGNRQQATVDGGGAGTRDSKPETRDSEAPSLAAALRAALLMQAEMPRFRNIRTPVKRFALKMKIGVAHGECLLAGVGDPAVRRDYVFAGAPVDATSDAEHHAVAGEIVFAGDRFQVPGSKFQVEEIEPGFWRVLGAVGELETRDSKFETSSHAEASGTIPPPSLPASVSSYLIREVHDQVVSGHASQVAALLEIVPVFLKFSGFTYTREGYDLELFDAFFRTLMEITHRHGGRLNRISMGDKGSTALLLFGAPNPLEKKEQLASQWALDLFAAVRSRFPRLDVGVGMNSGRVFTGIVGGSGRWEYTVMGDAVNFAARLMQGAEPGQAGASESFASRAREVYGFADLGKRRFKGKAEPLAVFALKERRRAGWTAGGLEQSVGRERETESLLERLDRAREGEPGMAVVEGEPGVGKSFLATRLLQTAHRRGWRTLPVRGEITRRSHAYAPWKDLFGDLLFQGMDPDLAMLEMVLREDQKPLLPWFAEFFNLAVPEGVEAPQHDEETKKKLFQHQLSRLLLDACLKSRVPGPEVGAGKRETRNAKPETDAGRPQPLFIFLDDLHWFDTLSMEFLATLLNHLKGQHLFLLGATRPDWEKKEFEHRATVSILALSDLDRAGCKTLAEGRLGGKVRDTLADFLYERTQGNPFFTHQLVDYLLHEDMLETRLGEWLLKRGVEQKGAMSGTEVLLAQVNCLPAAEQAHLRAAACMGPTFELEVLKAVLGRSYRAKAVQSLKASGYLFEQSQSETRDSRLETVSFPHALVQETLYQSIPQRVRKRLHRKIGLAMEILHSANLEPLYPNLANHFHLAGYRAKAVEYCLLAAKHLADNLSYPEACNFYGLAFSYLKRTKDARKWDIGLVFAEIQLRASRPQDGLLVARAIAKHAHASGRIDVMARASILGFDAKQLLGDNSYLQPALRLLEQVHKMSPDDLSYLKFLIGVASWRTGDFNQAAMYFKSIIGTQSASKDVVLRAISPMAHIEQNRGNHRQALEYLDSGLQLAYREKKLHQALKMAITRGIVLMSGGQLQKARQAFSMLIEEAERFGDYYLMATVMLNLGDIGWRLGDYSAAELYLEEAHRHYAQLGSLNGVAGCHKNKGIVHFFQEQYTEAYNEYLESIRLCEKAHEMQEAWHGYYNLAEVCVKMGRIGEAREWWEKGMASFAEKDNPGLRKMYLDLEGQIEA